MSKQVRVVLIVGNGRSGSTLLDRMLGETEGGFSLGEMLFIGEVILKKRLCGCEEPIHSCDFWQAVFDQAFGGFKHFDAEEFINLQKSVARMRHIPQLLFPRLQNSGFQSKLIEYSSLLRTLYKEIQEVSGARFLIDSSKSSAHGLVLCGLEEIDLRIIHLIRDSRATAFSWQRKKYRPEIQKEEAYMEQLSIPISAFRWALYNSTSHLLSHKISKDILIRYEDLATRPEEILPTIGKKLGIYSEDSWNLIKDKTITLHRSHTIAGNPMRFKHGEIEIRFDTEWQSKMPYYKRFATTFLTWPFLLKYKYF